MRIENVLFGSIIAIFYDGDLPTEGKLPKKENCVLFRAANKRYDDTGSYENRTDNRQNEIMSRAKSLIMSWITMEKVTELAIY